MNLIGVQGSCGQRNSVRRGDAVVRCRSSAMVGRVAVAFFLASVNIVTTNAFPLLLPPPIVIPNRTPAALPVSSQQQRRILAAFVPSVSAAAALRSPSSVARHAEQQPSSSSSSSSSSSQAIRDMAAFLSLQLTQSVIRSEMTTPPTTGETAKTKANTKPKNSKKKDPTEDDVLSDLLDGEDTTQSVPAVKKDTLHSIAPPPSAKTSSSPPPTTTDTGTAVPNELVSTAATPSLAKATTRAMDEESSSTLFDDTAAIDPAIAMFDTTHNKNNRHQNLVPRIPTTISTAFGKSLPVVQANIPPLQHPPAAGALGASLSSATSSTVVTEKEPISKVVSSKEVVTTASTVVSKSVSLANDEDPYGE